MRHPARLAALLLLLVTAASAPAHAASARQGKQVRPAARALARFTAAARKIPRGGRATPALERAAAELEVTHYEALTDGEKRRFQSILARTGVKTGTRILLPRDRRSYWHTWKAPLRDFRSSKRVPAEADLVIIGAGLAGSAAAYFAAEEARSRGLRVVVLEGGAPASQASGRNGGHFELVPQTIYGNYEGLVATRLKYLRAFAAPGTPEADLRRDAVAQSRALLRFGLKNRELFTGVVAREGLEVDFAQEGWVNLAASPDEEAGHVRDAELARELGIDDHVELLSPAEAKARLNIDTPYAARFHPGDGTYHPAKYVNGLLQRSIARGVKLYTHTRVRSVDSLPTGEHVIQTARGTIRARTVIAATGAFGGSLFPELANLEGYQSQVATFAHAPVRHSAVETGDNGYWYVNNPTNASRVDDPELAAATGGRITQRGDFVSGGGEDRPVHGGRARRSQRVLDDQLRQVGLHRPELAGQPPTHVWTGIFGFSPDRLPSVGELRKGLYVIQDGNGWGGASTTALGYTAVRMAIAGEQPEWAPQKVFSPRRIARQPQPPGTEMSLHDVLATQPQTGPLPVNRRRR